MKKTSALAIFALLLTCLVFSDSSQQATAEGSSSTVTKLTPFSEPTAVGDETNHIKVYMMVYRNAGYSSSTGTPAAILETLTPNCFEISPISGTSLDLSKPFSLSLSYGRTRIALLLDAYISTSWSHNTKWQIQLKCERFTPRKFTDNTNGAFEVGELVLEPFIMNAEWQYPVEPSAQTASLAKAWTTKDVGDYEFRNPGPIAGRNSIDHICITWAFSGGYYGNLKYDEEIWKNYPVWVSFFTIDNGFIDSTDGRQTECWTPEKYPQSLLSTAELIFKYKNQAFDYALVYAVSNNWGLKPLLVRKGAALASTKLEALQKFGLTQVVNPAAELSSVKVSAKNQKLDVSLTWPKNSTSDPLLDAEIAAVDQSGLRIVQSALYGLKSVKFQLPHGGKWKVIVRSGNALAWSRTRTSSLDVTGKPHINGISPLSLKIGHHFALRDFGIFGIPKPKVAITYFDCPQESTSPVVLEEGCKQLSSKIVSGPVPRTLLNHFVLAKIVAENSFGSDGFYTPTSTVGNFYKGGLSIKRKADSYELVDKADWGSAKPKLTVKNWLYAYRDDPASPIVGSNGKTTIKFNASSGTIWLTLTATSKEYGSLEIEVH